MIDSNHLLFGKKGTEGRRKRLVNLGFDQAQAAELSALHTKNFMCD